MWSGGFEFDADLEPATFDLAQVNHATNLLFVCFNIFHRQLLAFLSRRCEQNQSAVRIHGESLRSLGCKGRTLGLALGHDGDTQEQPLASPLRNAFTD